MPVVEAVAARFEKLVEQKGVWKYGCNLGLLGFVFNTWTIECMQALTNYITSVVFGSTFKLKTTGDIWGHLSGVPYCCLKKIVRITEPVLT